MKRVFSFVLVLVLMLSLVACGSGGGANATDSNKAADAQLKIGYAIADITPKYPVPLAGYGNTSMRMSEGFETYLYTTCMAISDGKTTLVLFQNDLINANSGVVSSVRRMINKDYGVPENQVMIAGTHTHSAPDLGNASEPSISKYRSELTTAMVQCAGEALEDMKPVTAVAYGSANPENLNFVRHYTTEAGIVKGDNFGDLVDSPYTGHTHKADNLMQVVKITREGGKDICMVNWQTHPHRAGSGKNITSDIVGVMRDHVQKQTGSLFLYWTGASGNINPSSRIADENSTADYWEQGKALGTHAVSIWNGEMTSVETGKVTFAANDFAGEVNHSEDRKVVYAQEVAQIWATNNNFIEAVTLANQYEINSPYHANGIIIKANLGATLNVEMYAFAIGELAFVTAPYEMYDENGVEIREGSPFKHTMIITCCNDAIGYIPSMEGYNNNTYGANTGRFVPGTGETLAQEYVKMLQQIKGQ